MERLRFVARLPPRSWRWYASFPARRARLGRRRAICQRHGNEQCGDGCEAEPGDEADEPPHCITHSTVDRASSAHPAVRHANRLREVLARPSRSRACLAMKSAMPAKPARQPTNAVIANIRSSLSAWRRRSCAQLCSRSCCRRRICRPRPGRGAHDGSCRPSPLDTARPSCS